MTDSISLSTLLTPSKTVSFEYPGLPNFFVDLCFLSREEMLKLRKRCVSTKFNRRTRQPEEELDEEKFATEYTQAVIKGWKGLKVSYLEELLLVDTSSLSADMKELVYTQDNAITLMKNSSDFDTWVVETVGDLANFSKTKSKK
jgi:hypothetical protein